MARTICVVFLLVSSEIFDAWQVYWDSADVPLYVPLFSGLRRDRPWAVGRDLRQRGTPVTQ